MKVKSLLLSAVLMCAVILVSCKKDDDGGTPAGSSGTMSLTYDGTNWTAGLTVQAVNTNGVINITGSDNNARQASVTLNNVTAPGTYKVGPNGNPSNQLRWTEGISTNQTYTASFVIGTGTITITELSATKVKGTFGFTGFNTEQASKTITSGKFDVNF